MNRLSFINNIKIRYKLLFVFSITFFFIMILSSLVIYSIVKRNVEENIQNGLQNATAAILNTVKTAVSVSIKNHLRATAEKNYEIIDYFHQQESTGKISLETAQKKAFEIILSQKVGENGYMCILDGQGRVLRHPRKSLEGLDISDRKFVQEMIAVKKGYIEYEWQNPDEPHPRDKALYLIHFEPWNWMITVASYRNEFLKLVNVNDFKDSILSMRFGNTGFSYIMDMNGSMIIHPNAAGVNHYEGDIDSNSFFNQMRDLKNGSLIYAVEHSDQNRSQKKLVFFNTIPEYGWIVASSGDLKEFYQPLATLRNLIIIVGFCSLILFIPISFILSSTITKPLRNLTRLFTQDIGNGFTSRLAGMESQDEIGQLTFYYNSYMDKLEDYDKNLNTEIAERKQIQEALIESEEKYRSVMEATPDPIVVYDTNGRITFMNPAFTKIFGYTFEDRLDRFIPKEHSQAAVTGFEAILSGKTMPMTETQRMTKDGVLIDVTLQGSAYRNTKGRPIGSVIAHRDVSELKRLEKAIMETGEKERQKIGSDLHDDLCPHLIGIEGLSKVLKNKIGPLSEESKALADQIILFLKEAISKTRRLARGLCPAYFEHGLESSLGELVTYTQTMHRMNCRLDVQAKIPSLSNLAVINLYHIAQEAVNNAIRHGSADSIEIGLRHTDHQIHLSITDNGLGFEKINESKGMGLRIMKYRASLIGASLVIQSEKDNGVRVTVMITDKVLPAPTDYPDDRQAASSLKPV